MKKALIGISLMLLMLASVMAGSVYDLQYKDKWVIWDSTRTINDDDVVVNADTVSGYGIDRLLNSGGFGYSKFWKAMRNEVLDWLKTIFVTREDFDAEFLEYKLEQEELNRVQNARIFRCEEALGMTRGYE